MSHSSEERLPVDLLAVAEQLREGSHEASALDLDRIKMRAIAKAERGSGAFASRKGRTTMRKRRLLITALIMGIFVSGTGATLAVTGQFAGTSQNRPTASAAQYVSCKTLVRSNRRDESATRSSNRRSERRIRNNRDRRQVRRANRGEERQQRRVNRSQERACRRNG